MKFDDWRTMWNVWLLALCIAISYGSWIDTRNYLFSRVFSTKYLFPLFHLCIEGFFRFQSAINWCITFSFKQNAWYAYSIDSVPSQKQFIWTSFSGRGSNHSRRFYYSYSLEKCNRSCRNRCCISCIWSCKDYLVIWLIPILPL